MNLTWCKIRRYWIITNNIISFSLLAVQSIDIFLCSSTSVTLRQKINIKNAHRIIIGILFFGLLHSLPFLYYENIIVSSTGSVTCVTNNATYNQYQLYFINLCMYVVIPVSIIFIFGLLTYRNVHSNNLQIQQRILTGFVRQMIRMHVYNMIIVIIFVTPYGVIQLYISLVNSFKRMAIRIAEEQLVSNFSTIYFYGAYVSSFYCCYASSRRFREQFWSSKMNVLVNLLRRRN